MRVCSLALAAIVATGAAPALAMTINHDDHSIEGVRNARYCEIIPVKRDGFHLVATVYNTLGHGDCPAAVWEKISAAEMKERFGALKVMLNGPRHFLMDRIIAAGGTAEGKTIDVGGIKLTQRASIDLDLWSMRALPYRERTIERETKYVFDAGKPVFVLVAADGSRYAMQAYAQIVDKTLTYDALPELATRLKLPDGWRYEMIVPKEDLVLGAHGSATVIQDNLQDTYQKID